MFLYYIDASADREKFVLSAIRLPSDKWREAFGATKEFRHSLKDQFGVYVRKEFHALQLVTGRGQISSRTVAKFHRTQIFESCLRFIASLPDVQILNVSIDVPGCPVDPYVRAFERLLNRVEANLKDAGTQGIVILDEGKEAMIRKVARQMSAFNWIPSRFGGWQNGNARKKILVSRVLEDPVFRTSDSSYFLQFADAVAFALLKHEVKPTPVVAKYEIHKMFELLKPVLCIAMSPADPYGIERG